MKKAVIAKLPEIIKGLLAALITGLGSALVSSVIWLSDLKAESRDTKARVLQVEEDHGRLSNEFKENTIRQNQKNDLYLGSLKTIEGKLDVLLQRKQGQ